MEDLRQRVTWRVGGWIAPLLVDRAPADLLRRRVVGGFFDEAVENFDEIVDSLSTASANASALELAEIAADLDRLTQLRRDQQSLAERLAPPLPHIFFWTSPGLSMLEVLFWSLLGVLAVVTSVLAWQWREHRGPEMVVGLCIGLVAAAAVAAGVGALLVRMRYGALDFDTVTLAGLAFGQTVLSRAVQAAGIAWDSNEAHSAVYDTERTAELFCYIVNRWRHLNVVESAAVERAAAG